MSQGEKHEILVAIGDWSNDGHGKCKEFIFKTSHDQSTVIAAYEKAVAACGVGVVSTHPPKKNVTIVCSDYEDSKIPAEAYAKLKKLGVTFEGMENMPGEDDDGETELYVGAACLARIFMQMVATQIPGFNYEPVAKPHAINFGGPLNGHIGYGVFH